MKTDISRVAVKDKCEFRVLIVYPNLPMMMIVPVAIGLFTRIFRDEGYVVDLFDTTFYVEEGSTYLEEREEMFNVRKLSIEDEIPLPVMANENQDFRKKVEGFQPDFIIFSVVEDSFFKTVNLLKSIHNLNIPHLVGGIFPTSVPDRCLEYDEINIIGIGEGEKTIIEVAEAIRLGRSLKSIKGTWHRDSGGKIHKNPPQSLTDINDVIPDYSLFDESRFWRPVGGYNFKAVPVESYRGCPYSCTYCNSPGQRVFSKDNDLGIFLRRKTMEQLRTELRQYVELYDPTFFFFIDDSFLARSRREIFDFCDMYEEFRLPFFFNTRAENCKPDTLARLKEVGCYRMSFGLECGNEEYRSEVLRRKVSNERYLKHFAIINESGIAWNFNIIIGLPGETRDLVMDTIELCCAVKGYDSITVNIFTPYYGTELRKICVKNDWIDSDNMSKHVTASSVLKMPPPYLNADEINGLAAVFPLYCYFPKSDWNDIRRAESSDKEGLRIRQYYADIYREKFLGETQDWQKNEIVVGGTGCRVGPKDAFRKNISRLTPEEITMLT